MKEDTLIEKSVGRVIEDYPEEDEHEAERKDVVIDGRVYKPHVWKPGQSGNPAGRPKGTTLKEWTRNRFLRMTDEERDAFLAGMPKETVWQMAEGRPTEDKNISIVAPTPILGGVVLAENALEAPSDNDTKEADTSIA